MSATHVPVLIPPSPFSQDVTPFTSVILVCPPCLLALRTYCMHCTHTQPPSHASLLNLGGWGTRVAHKEAHNVLMHGCCCLSCTVPPTAAWIDRLLTRALDHTQVRSACLRFRGPSPFYLHGSQQSFSNLSRQHFLGKFVHCLFAKQRQ